jgi:xanthine dehydrogenase YagS FAD-binding subunit
MKALTSRSPRDLSQAAAELRAARTAGQQAVVAGGGSDLLGMVKERLIAPDVIVRLAGLANQNQVRSERNGGVTIGGQITLTALSQHQAIRARYRVLADAAASVATPQIRNVGTLAGNLAQRPWCWYYRNGFKCFKNGGNTCYSVAGENHFHAIFGGGPSYIVHPSDTAPALVALDAMFRLVGPAGERTVPAAEFFALPTAAPARENVLREDEILASVTLPPASARARSLYHKVLDREAWTHAIVSAAIVLDTDQDVVRQARIVLGGVAPIPWRLPEVERMLVGQRVTEDLAAQAGAAALSGARPLSHNAYKLPLTENMVKRSLLDAASLRV